MGNACISLIQEKEQRMANASLTKSIWSAKGENLRQEDKDIKMVGKGEGNSFLSSSLSVYQADKQHQLSSLISPSSAINPFSKLLLG